ncbi:MAG: hypothetical protein Q9220_006992 [cf. Caloplaca sp. 1 TL-2023]
MSEDHYDGISTQLNDDESIVHSEIGSESYLGEEDMMNRQQAASRKRKRGPEISYKEQQHTLYADNLLDYFMLSESDRFYRLEPPQPPDGFEVNRPIDDQGHTALHWGAAMGDITTMRMFINRRARIAPPNVRGETPLIRAVLFTNNYEKETMPKLVDILLDTIMERDRYGATVLHHVAMTTKSSSRKKSARYYLDVLLTKLSDILPPQEFIRFLEIRDNNGDTAMHIVARHNARKCVRIFLGRGVNVEIPNNNNETAAEIMQRSHAYRVEDFTAMASSSPVQPLLANGSHHNHHHNNTDPFQSSSAVMTTSKPAAASFGPSSSQYETQSAQSFSTSFGPTVNDKALQMTLAMEDELQSMDASLAETTRLIESTSNERGLVRQQTFQLSMEDDNNTNSTNSHNNNGEVGGGNKEQEMRQLAEQNAYFTAANESLSEQDQHRFLHNEIRKRERLVPSHILTSPTSPSNPSSTTSAANDTSLNNKLAAAHLLAQQQSRRRDLSRELVQAQAAASMSDKGDVFKRLIAGCVGVKVEDVAGMVPEVLRELEFSAGGRGGGGGAAGVGGSMAAVGSNGVMGKMVATGGGVGVMG